MTRGLPKKIIIRYLGALIIISTIFWQAELDRLPLVGLSFPTIRFLAMTFIALQTFAIVYRLRNSIDFSKSDNIIVLFSNGFRVLIYISLFFLLLRYNGIGVLQFFTSLSIVAAAIAIVSKDYLTSLISGFFISFTKIMNINDSVTIGEVSGRVKEIKLTKLYLENSQGELIILSNDKVFHSDIINHSKSNKRRIGLKFELATSVEYDIENLEKSLIHALEEFDDQIKKGSFSLRVDNILSDKICYSFYYTLEKLEAGLEKTTRRKTLRQLIQFIQSRHKE